MFHTIWYLYDLMTTTLGKINGTVCVQSSTVYRPTQNVNKQFDARSLWSSNDSTVAAARLLSGPYDFSSNTEQALNRGRWCWDETFFGQARKTR